MSKPTAFARCLVAALALSVFSQAALAAEGTPFSLRLMHTNDVHARYAPITKYGSACDPADADAHCIAGVARLATALGEARDQAPAETSLLLVDAGDQFQGSLFYTYYKAGAAIRLMPELGYQAMVLGNHEFDDGPPQAARLAEGVPFPVLASNLEGPADSDLMKAVVRRHMMDLDGRRVGLFGLITPDTANQSSPGPTLRFQEPQAVAEREVAALTVEGADIIIALTHLGYDADKALAAAVDGIDVIVGGHSHTWLGSGKDDAGPYPTVIDTPSGDPVLVVQAGSMGRALGLLDVTFDAAGVATDWAGGPRMLDESVAPDATMAGVVADMTKPLAAMLNKPVGTVAQDLPGRREVCRVQECALGNLITDAMLAAAAPEGALVALINAGALRAGLSAGSVSLGDILTMLPFSNTLATFGLKGADLAAALEHGVSVADDPTAGGTGRFLQVAGVRFAWDASKPVGQRVSGIEIKGADGAWVALDPDATYGVATIGFLRGGGDGYAMFAQAAIDPYDHGETLERIVSDYIKAHSPARSGVHGRITGADGG